MTAPTATAADELPLSALEMARNCLANVERIARVQASDDPDTQLQAFVHNLGSRGQQAATLAGQMALVAIAEDMHSIAADVHWLVAIMTGRADAEGGP
jgi:hypothetical protein